MSQCIGYCTGISIIKLHHVHVLCLQNGWGVVIGTIRNELTYRIMSREIIVIASEIGIGDAWKIAFDFIDIRRFMNGIG